MATVKATKRGRPRLIQDFAPCLECSGTATARRIRGLCMACYQHPEIKAKYPMIGPGFVEGAHEPTWEELEQCVAEQMMCLPPWWWSSFDRALTTEEEVEARRAAARKMPVLPGCGSPLISFSSGKAI